MKMFAKLCMVGSVLALAACAGHGAGYHGADAPYAHERTAGAHQAAPVRTQPQQQPAERIYQRRQAK